MRPPALISVDWGTTSLRVVLVAADASILARDDSGPGINPQPEIGFAAILRSRIGGWLDQFGPLPIVMSGMIGSRQGWAEVPYLPCPCSARHLAAGLHRIETSECGAIHIVPGLAMTPPDPPPEVMRGEESQIVGAFGDGNFGAQTHSRLFVLPGTHSKWATTENGAISSFATYMTGEVFAALCKGTILGRLMPEQPAAFEPAAFERGVGDGAAAGHPGALLNRIFATRTLGLFDRLPPSGLESYLSGLLIGAEIAAATEVIGRLHDAPITIIGTAGLIERYRFAATVLDLNAALAPPECAPRGHVVIARAAGLLKAAS